MSLVKKCLIATTAITLVGCNSSYVKSVQKNRGGEAQVFSGAELADNSAPNDATISLAEDRRLSFTSSLKANGNAYIIKPKGNAVDFPETPNLVSASLEQELAEGFILSYLFYDNGVIKYNGLAKPGRFDRDITDQTLFFTHSTGKTIVSYIVGHAICKGYIDSVDEPVNWPMMSNTLYQGQPLKNLLDMSAGDSHLYDRDTVRPLAAGGQHHRSIGHDTLAHYLDGTVSKGSSVHYNNALTDIIASYVAYKTGDDYDELIRSIFQDKVKIENEVLFELHRKSWTNGSKSPYYGDMQTRASYSFQMTSKDLLRVAVAMLEDYQNGTCVGNYLKDVQARAKSWPKYSPIDRKRHFWLLNYARDYGGQIYWDFYGMSGRNILGTDGRNGQHFLIDLDNSKIVVTNSANVGFDIRHFILDAIKNGEVPK